MSMGNLHTKARKASPDHREEAFKDPALRELLDHLGKLLTKEYIALLAGSGNLGVIGPEGDNS
jgi:hypothetical protein